MNDGDQASTLPASPSELGISARAFPIQRFGQEQLQTEDFVAVEDPLEVQLTYGPRGSRITKAISVTMRTPGNDAELVAGFLLTEGVLNDAAQIEAMEVLHATGNAHGNTVRVTLEPSVELSLATLERNFYTTSSCGICGKASLLALRSVCPPRAKNTSRCRASVVRRLPAALRQKQTVFQRTGGLHACGLFDADGCLISLREDVGRHNACDKLIGGEFLADRTPLRNRILLLSGRASFELLQKGVMAGIPIIVAVGAPSTLAIEVAKDFDVTLIGFVRDQSFNVYHGAERVLLDS